MKLHYYKPDDSTSNFGDELNAHIWSFYFPNLFDENEKEVFFGIGTIIKEASKFYKEADKVLIFGSGARSNNVKILSNVEIEFVRGPLTAECLGVPNKFITDPAILTPEVFKRDTSKIKKKWKFSYMPHFSAANDVYKKVFNSVGIHYIDPREDLDKIIDEINETETILTEAMHGAIVADAYRVNWLPIKTYESFNYFKWKDWALSNQLDINIFELPRFYKNDSKIKFLLKKVLFTYKVKKIKKLPPYLSSDKVFKDNLIKMKGKIKEFLHK